MPHNLFGWDYPPGCSGPPEPPIDDAPEVEEILLMLEPYKLPQELVDQIADIVQQLADSAEQETECPVCMQRQWEEERRLAKQWEKEEAEPPMPESEADDD